MRLIWMLTLLLITACTPLIPATTPPQLEHTPGAFVRIDDEGFDAGIFRVNYPDGWRTVKTSVATAAIEVVFVSPDDTMTIRILEGNPPETTPAPDSYERRVSLEVTEDTTVTVLGHAPLVQQAAFDEVFDAVLNSIVLSQ